MTNRFAPSRIALGFVWPALVASAIVASGCSSEPENVATEEDDLSSARTQYVDIGQFLKGADYEKWFTARRALEQGFDQICGDTFCGGDYSNIYSLGFACSVSSKIGKVRECMWTFAASQEEVDARSGTIASSVAFFECRVKPTGNASGLVAAFGADPLNAKLPGMGSIYDTLSDCFDKPLGASPLPAPTAGGFVSAADAIEGTDIDAYYAMTGNLRTTFDDVCGDTFCEGEYTNYQPLRFTCSQGPDKKIGTCSWTFAASETNLLSGGTHKVTRAPFVCTIPVKGTIRELSTVLAPGGATRLFERKLPGTNETLNDALGRCL